MSRDMKLSEQEQLNIAFFVLALIFLILSLGVVVLCIAILAFLILKLTKINASAALGIAAFASLTPEGWLKYNSIEHAPDMGSFVFNRYVNFEARLTKWQKIKESIYNALNPHWFSVSEEPEEKPPDLTMNTGQACMLIVAQELDLPFVPITVHREEGDEDHIELLKNLIGYDGEVEPVSYCYDFIKHKPVEISPYYSGTSH